MRKLITVAAALAVVAAVGLNLRAGDDPKPIKEIIAMVVSALNNCEA